MQLGAARLFLNPRQRDVYGLPGIAEAAGAPYGNANLRARAWSGTGEAGRVRRNGVEAGLGARRGGGAA